MISKETEDKVTPTTERENTRPNALHGEWKAELASKICVYLDEETSRPNQSVP